MKGIFIHAIVLAVVAGAASPIAVAARAADDPLQLTPDLRLGASVRLRYENKRGFLFDDSLFANDDRYFLSRIRMNLDWKPSDRFRGFLELQDAGIQSSRVVDSDAVPNVFADALDIHQLFADLRFESKGKPIRLRVGRQKLRYGAERLISPLEWVNTARVFDGASARFGLTEGRDLDVFLTRLVPVDPNRFNDHGPSGNRLFDSDFHGAYYSDTKLIPDTRFEAYLLLRDEDAAGDSVYTLGARFAWEKGSWSAEAEIARQFGDYGGLDHEAGMFHAEVNYVAEKLRGSRFGLGYSFGSGDDDPTDGDHETFDNLYPLNHAFYGYMDFFSLQNLHNWEADFSTVLCPYAVLRVALHDFRLAQEDTDAWYNAAAGVVRTASTNVDGHVGNEIDVTVQGDLWRERLGYLVGLSRFEAGDFVSDTGSPDDDATFYYLQIHFSF